MLAGADTLEVNGQVIAQIGNMDSFGSDHTTINLTNTTEFSRLHIDSIYAQFNGSNPNGNLVNFPASGTNFVTVGESMISPTAPSGFTKTNTASGQGGVGTYQEATYATVH